jgi:hypothetical protein
MHHIGRIGERQRAGLAVLLLLTLSGCTAEELFRQGRVHEPCGAVYPTCHAGFAAGCYLDGGRYTTGQFPGARRVLVTSTQPNQFIRVRLFFTNMIYPGTTILVQAYEPDCGDVSSDLREDVDVFEEAGNDLVIIFDLEASRPGDHLVEFYSDCASDYLLTADPVYPEDI